MNNLFDKDTQKILFLGQGWTYPFGYDSTGSVSMSYCTIGNYRLIKESIMHILGVRSGERWMLRNFGCNLRKFVFEPLNDITEISVKSTISDALAKWEPRISLAGNGLGVTTKVYPTEKKLEINTVYRILRANTSDNLVLIGDWNTQTIIEKLNET